GDGDQVDVGVVQGHELREGTPVGEAGLGLPLAHLLVPRRARGAAAAGADERHRDPVPRAPSGDPVADRLDDTGEFVARYVGQGDVRVVALPAVPVAAAQTGGLDAHDDSVSGRLRVG